MSEFSRGDIQRSPMNRSFVRSIIDGTFPKLELEPYVAPTAAERAEERAAQEATYERIDAVEAVHEAATASIKDPWGNDIKIG